MKFPSRIICTLVAVMLCGTSQAALYTNIVNPPGRVSFTWTASPTPGILGYRIYWGAATHAYTNYVEIGPTNVVTLTNLVRGVRYYCAATAWDLDDNGSLLESGFSNEATYTPQLPPLPPTGFGSTNMVVAMRVEYAPTVNGPWTLYANLATTTEAPAFFRSRVSITPPAVPSVPPPPAYQSPKRKAT